MNDTAALPEDSLVSILRETGRGEMADALEWALAEADRLNAAWADWTPPAPRWRIPDGATAADTICHTCRGFGTLTDTHAYGDPTICPCHRCGGSGLKA